jgi:hypothetical protein
VLKSLYLGGKLGGKNFVKRTLVSFDTDRIKGYVFGTDKLKEIRGASAILDGLNREKMIDIAREIGLGCKTIYANGGSGMFLIDGDETDAERFGQKVKQEYRRQTYDNASITYVYQELPTDASPGEKVMDFPLEETLEWLRYKMRKEKDHPSDFTVLASHPFMRPCDACGINYAEPGRRADEEEDEDEPAGVADYYCASCRAKRGENKRIRENIDWAIKNYTRGSKKRSEITVMEEPLWQRIIYHLKEDNYKFPAQKPPRRPNDFNVFRQFSKSKEYIGLIYADGNNMGSHVEEQKTLNKTKEFSLRVDNAIHQALSAAIKEHLPIEGDKKPLFPFDVLLLGGDDLMIVTDAAKAMDVALTIAKKFREFSYKAGEEPLSLSVGVILAPVKYPFSLLQELAEETLKAAKKGSTKARIKGKEIKDKIIDDTRISFLVIAGSSVHSYKRTVEGLEEGKDSKGKGGKEFHATLRPYDTKTLESLLDAIDDANKSSFNRSKLHQMREAILKMNLTSSVTESMATMRNWQPGQRKTVVNSLYKIGMQTQFEKQTEVEPIPFSDFPRVTIPWFYDGKNEYNNAIYRTSILDFIELYDFVHREAKNDKTTH